jgi:hypothetical protein
MALAGETGKRTEGPLKIVMDGSGIYSSNGGKKEEYKRS